MADWDKYFNTLYKSRAATDVTSAALKTVNVLGEAGLPGFKQAMEWTDDKAYKIGSQGDASTRSLTSINEAMEEDPRIESRTGYYTGIYKDDRTNWSRGGEQNTPHPPDTAEPNLLKMFLGIDENTLPESEFKPTSWTKGEPAQGWRSTKEFSSLDVRSPKEFKEFYKNDIIPPLNTKAEIDHFVDTDFSDIKGDIDEMRQSVSRGKYTPDMAVKGDKFPGLKYDTRVNVGHMTKSIGYDTDKKQYYFSTSDVWDFKPKEYEQTWGENRNYMHRTPNLKEKSYTQASLMQASGKGIGLYDRYYLPDNYMTDWFGEEKVEDNFIQSFEE